ncbi:MAG: hypothetical protein GXP54_01075 [Deltaproteobacteria bacterium]|nr:hypothetical protein [Deltaproteobacteria bacterium]
MPPEIREHVAGCAACRDLSDVYCVAVDSVREVMDEHSVLVPDMASIHAGLRAMDRERFGVRRFIPRTVPGVAVAAAVATAVAISVWWGVGLEGGGQVDGVGPVAVGVPRPVFSVDVRDDGSRAAVDRSYSVVAGQTIQTADAGVVINDARIGSVHLSSRTRVRIGSWDTNRTLLYLDTGTIVADVEHRGPGHTFEVHTEFVTVSVVGTRFKVSHVEGSLTTITTIRGTIRVDTFSGVEVAAMGPGKVLKVGPSIVLGPSPVGVEVAMATEPKDRSNGRISKAARRVPSGKKAVKKPPRGIVASTTKPPLTAEELIAKARGLLANGRNREAVECLEAFKGARGRSSVLALLGDAYLFENRLTKAENTYKEALSAGPSPAPEGVLVDLARLYHDKLKAPKKAEAAWKRYLDTYPHGRYSGEAMYRLAGLDADAGRAAEVSGLLRRVVREAPGSPWAVRALSDVGVGLSREGKAVEAAAWFAEFKDSKAAELAEAALVGLMRVRDRQGDSKAVQTLASEYFHRFPKGKWREVVRELSESR